MPVIINEIEVAVEVVPNNGASSAATNNINSSSKEEIIKECVEKVMEILNQKKER